MQSNLFEQGNLENETTGRFALQNSHMLRVHVDGGSDVLAIKGSMVAYQGQVQFHHEGSGSVGKLLKKILTNEDLPLMRVQGQGDVFFASQAGRVFLLELQGDGITVNSTSLLAFDAALNWDIRRVQGLGMLSAGAFNTVIEGTGVVALHSVGQPVVLDCSQQPTFVDTQSAVAWSASLQPQIVSSMNMRSLLRGGTGEAFQYAFHGPGFVVVQPYENVPQNSGSEGGSAMGWLNH